MADKDFVAIFADHGSPHRGGALGIFSRSLRIDIGSTEPKDFVADPNVLDPNSDERARSELLSALFEGTRQVRALHVPERAPQRQR
ncbi:hypothetical protein, partial [Clostridioides difficile]|uniref:hypothetical protein n=1 Tax=Clostridioides difficile TaxID=1496 RepID=UPI001A9B836F